jgi:hypothetical protein
MKWRQKRGRTFAPQTTAAPQSVIFHVSIFTPPVRLLPLGRLRLPSRCPLSHSHPPTSRDPPTPLPPRAPSPAQAPPPPVGPGRAATSSKTPSWSFVASCHPCSIAGARPREDCSRRLSPVHQPESGQICPSVPLRSRPSPNLRPPARRSRNRRRLPH